MPRKQRFKPSRKPKQDEPTTNATASENRPVRAVPAVIDDTPEPRDASNDA